MKKFLAIIMLMAGAQSLSARESQLFDKGWLFTLADSAGMEQANYVDINWRHLDLPHDWAIEGDFSPANPSGASGGALPGGIGWYRKHFSVNPKENNKRYVIAFDGVYMNATVYVNGHKLGTRPYGYSSFEYDITPYINKVGDNVARILYSSSIVFASVLVIAICFEAQNSCVCKYMLNPCKHATKTIAAMAMLVYFLIYDVFCSNLQRYTLFL